MKTKGHWVIKYEDDFYYCGNNTFDKQLRKAQIYHWKEAAEEQAENMKKRRYSKVADTAWEVIAVVPPQELTATEAKWLTILNAPLVFACSYCHETALNDSFGQSIDSKFCPSCGKYMTNHTQED